MCSDQIRSVSVDSSFDENAAFIEERVWKALADKGLTISTAESCTGGSIAVRITSVAGCSSYYKGGIVAYANEVKTNLLQVEPEILEKYGAVSEEVVVSMVKGAMETMQTDCAIATSGIAGPAGGTSNKPVGTIWIAVGNKDEILTMKLEGDRGRKGNIDKTVEKALWLLYNLVG